MLRLALAADRPLRLLCIGAHADDIEIGCGGTIRRLLCEHRETRVHWLVLSGDQRRHEEARASAQRILAQAAASVIELLSFRDGFFPAQYGEIKEAFERLKRTVDPALIFTHFRGDLHQDHRIAAEMTYSTFRDHLILEYDVPKYDGDLDNPNVFVPLSEDIARQKVSGLLEHFPSQRSRSWFSAETFLAMMRLRGIGCNAPAGHAEAFYCRKAVL
jgi:LmbE family N-acetylglucosaminyl deacetylase